MDVDMTVIGAGPVGLYAADYAGFRGMRTAIVDSLPEPGCARSPRSTRRSSSTTSPASPRCAAGTWCPGWSTRPRSSAPSGCSPTARTAWSTSTAAGCDHHQAGSGGQHRAAGHRRRHRHVQPASAAGRAALLGRGLDYFVTAPDEYAGRQPERVHRLRCLRARCPVTAISSDLRIAADLVPCAGRQRRVLRPATVRPGRAARLSRRRRRVREARRGRPSPR